MLWEKEKREVTSRLVENETNVDLVLIGKGHLLFVQNVKAITVGFQHALVTTDIDKKIRNVMKRHIQEKKDNFAEKCENPEMSSIKVMKVVGVTAPNLWGHLKDAVLKTCGVVYGKVRGRRSKGDT